MAAASAADEPEISEKNIVETITTKPKPPLICLTITLARLTSLLPTPPVSRKEPANTNSGMARRGKESSEVNIFCGIKIRGTFPLMQAVIALATPKDKAIGVLRAIRRAIKVNNITIIFLRIFLS
jgi:hypothetical protein